MDDAAVVPAEIFPAKFESVFVNVVVFNSVVIIDPDTVKVSIDAPSKTSIPSKNLAAELNVETPDVAINPALKNT